MKNIFIACPISKYINGHSFSNEELRSFIDSLYNMCLSYSPNIFLALKREEYGKKLMPDTCTRLDYAEMKNTDLVIAIPEDSTGTAVELGWASAFKKQIIVLLKRGERYTPLITRLSDITEVRVVYYDNLLSPEIMENIEMLIATYLRETE